RPAPLLRPPGSPWQSAGVRRPVHGHLLHPRRPSQPQETEALFVKDAALSVPPTAAGEPRPAADRYVRYLAIAARAASMLALTASRLKLAPRCIGGNSIAVLASSSTFC